MEHKEVRVETRDRIMATMGTEIKVMRRKRMSTLISMTQKMLKLLSKSLKNYTIKTMISRLILEKKHLN
jgi:hypothetical protein